MATFRPKQELPPPSGYEPLDFSRKPARAFMRTPVLFGVFAGVQIVGAFLWKMSTDQFEREQTELRSSMLALLPMLFAERDREYLKQLRRNRDEEAELMKNVDGWVVGTYYGKPIYKTLPPDTLLKRNQYEYFAHAIDDAFFKRIDMKLMS